MNSDFCSSKDFNKQSAVNVNSSQSRYMDFVSAFPDVQSHCIEVASGAWRMLWLGQLDPSPTPERLAACGRGQAHSGQFQRRLAT